jgi:hypothetical protein
MKHYNIEVRLPGEKEPAISHYNLRDRPTLSAPSGGYRFLEFQIGDHHKGVSLPPEALVTITCFEK